MDKLDLILLAIIALAALGVVLFLLHSTRARDLEQALFQERLLGSVLIAFKSKSVEEQVRANAADKEYSLRIEMLRKDYEQSLKRKQEEPFEVRTEEKRLAKDDKGNDVDLNDYEY